MYSLDIYVHRSQSCSSNLIRYSGTPLKYSFSEANDQKSVTLVEVREKGNFSVTLIPLHAKRDMVELKGTYNELMLKSFWENTTYGEDYVHIILTDEDDIPDVITKLRVVYKNIMKLDYDNKRTRTANQILGADGTKDKTPFEYFNDFYQLQNGQAMSEDQGAFITNLIEQIWEGDGE